MTNGKSKKAKKRLLIVASVVIILAIVITALNLISLQNLLKKGEAYSGLEIKNQLTPQKDENGYWYFTTDGDFKVMHLTDIHIGSGWMCHGRDKKTLNAVATMITKEKPDLVIAHHSAPMSHLCLIAVKKRFSDIKTIAKTVHKNGGILIVEGLHALNPIIFETLPQESLFKIYISIICH